MIWLCSAIQWKRHTENKSKLWGQHGHVYLLTFWAFCSHEGCHSKFAYLYTWGFPGVVHYHNNGLRDWKYFALKIDYTGSYHIHRWFLAWSYSVVLQIQPDFQRKIKILNLEYENIWNMMCLYLYNSSNMWWIVNYDTQRNSQFYRKRWMNSIIYYFDLSGGSRNLLEKEEGFI